MDELENGGPRIVVLGSLNMDFAIRADKMPVAGESLIGESFELALGGKGANQAVATARMGARVSLAGKVGADVFGDRLCEAMQQEGLDVSHLRRDANVSTGAAFIMLEPSGQNRIIVLPGANLAYSVDELDDISVALQGADLLLLQLEMDYRVVERAVQLAHDLAVPVILNPGPTPTEPLSADLIKKLRCITPNEVEAEALTGIRVESPQDAELAAEAIRREGVGQVVITLGEQGAVVCERDGCTFIPPYPVQAVDTVAAGDTFTGALAVRLCEGAELTAAAQFASAAAAMAVTRNGAMASIPSRHEVEQFLVQCKDGELRGTLS